MPDLVGVNEAAAELNLDPSRVRALIADGSLRAEKISGRWLVHWDSVAARRREPTPPGRPMTPRNAWALLLLASGEPIPEDLDPTVGWRLRQTLTHQGLIAVRRRLERRAHVGHLWALPGELRALRTDKDIVLTGSSASGALGLELAAPDTIDAYVRASRLDVLIAEHGLEAVASIAQANVTVRTVADDAWLLDGRRNAPATAVALDLSFYTDSRSARVGSELLHKLDRGIEST